MLGLPADRPIVLAPRGVRDVYRPQDIVRALPEVAATVPEVLCVVLCEAGREGEADQLRRLAAELDVAENLELTARLPHERVPLVYRAASVCVSTPASDSAPTSVFEALALGVPAVVSDLPWVHEPVYREARLGIVPVGDHLRLAEAILERITAPISDDQEQNRRLVATHFDRNRVFEGVEVDYRRLSTSTR
jgi:glycosyltransferase involved in cell wall biosynthesis